VQILHYYGGSDRKKLAQPHRFTFETDDFEVFDLIAELDVNRTIPLAPLFRGL
jgi:hypothetical protein